MKRAFESCTENIRVRNVDRHDGDSPPTAMVFVRRKSHIANRIVDWTRRAAGRNTKQTERKTSESMKLVYDANTYVSKRFEANT